MKRFDDTEFNIIGHANNIKPSNKERHVDSFQLMQTVINEYVYLNKQFSELLYFNWPFLKYSKYLYKYSNSI